MSELAKKMKLWYEARINLLEAEMELELEKMSARGPSIPILKPVSKSKVEKRTPAIRVITKKSQPKRISHSTGSSRQRRSNYKKLDIDEIIRLKDLGYSQKHIAEMMDVSAPTIGNRLKANSEKPHVATIQLDAPSLRESPNAHLKSKPKRYTKNVSKAIFGFTVEELLDNCEMTTERCISAFPDFNVKSVASAFSAISMFLTDIDGTFRRIAGRGGKVTLVPKNMDKIKNSTLFELHTWRQERYNQA